MLTLNLRKLEVNKLVDTCSNVAITWTSEVSVLLVVFILRTRKFMHLVHGVHKNESTVGSLCLSTSFVLKTALLCI